MRTTLWTFAGIAALWLAAVAVAAETGALAGLAPMELGPVIAASVLLPATAVWAVPPWRAAVERLGLRPLTALHVWRIPAAIAFFGYGMTGALPPLFWIPAGVGDLAVGLYAAWTVTRPNPTAADYRRFHIVGFADFVIAVGAGLAHSLAQDPRMAAVTALPLAVIPFFGVGISGASHLLAFGLIRRQARTPAFPSGV